MSNEKSKHHLHIVLTPEQYQLLSGSAKKCGLTRRAFVVRLLEGTEIRTRPSQEIKDLRTEIHHIGNNIVRPDRALCKAEKMVLPRTIMWEAACLTERRKLTREHSTAGKR